MGSLARGELAGLARRAKPTKVQAWSAGLSTVLVPFEELVVEAGYDYQDFGTETEDVRFHGGVPAFGTRGYHTWIQGGHLNLFWEVTPLFRMEGGISFQASEGDYSTTSVDAFLGLSCDIRDRWAVGSDIRWVRYNEENAAVDDYKAWIVETWLKVGF